MTPMTTEDHMADLARWLRTLAKGTPIERNGVVADYFSDAAKCVDALVKDKARLDWLLHECVEATNQEMGVTIHWGLSNAGRSTIDAARKKP